MYSFQLKIPYDNRHLNIAKQLVFLTLDHVIVGLNHAEDKILNKLKLHFTAKYLHKERLSQRFGMTETLMKSNTTKLYTFLTYQCIQDCH